MVFATTTDIPVPISKKAEFSFLRPRDADTASLTELGNGLTTEKNTDVGRMSEARSVKRSINVKRLTEHSGTAGELSRMTGSSVGLHGGKSTKRFNRTDQYSAAGSQCLCYSIHAMVGMDWIDVQCARRAAHGSISGCFSSRSVTGWGTTGEIGRGFHNAATNPVTLNFSHEPHAQKFTRDL